MIDVLQQAFPNFPEEILVDWLCPRAQECGWPPALQLDGLPDDRWRALFRHKPISYWRELSWTKHDLQLSPYALNESSMKNISGIFEAAVLRFNNIYSDQISDLLPRFQSIVEYITDEGFLPRPPILLNINGQFDVVDGNHRLAALFFCQGLFNGCIPPSPSKPIKAHQPFWVGQPNHSMQRTVPLRGPAADFEH